MALDNYVNLTAAVQDWSAKFTTSVAARVPDFIRLAEERIWISGEQVLRSQWGVTRANITIPAGLNYAALPEGWLRFVRVRSATEPLIEYMSPDMLEDLPAPGNTTKYSVEGGKILYGLAAGSTVDQVLDVRYMQHPGNLDAVATHWAIQRAPSIFLYGSLLEAALYVKNAEKVAEYGSMFKRAIEGFMAVERADMIAGSRLRISRA